MSSIPAPSTAPLPEVIALPAFTDNYIWAIVAHGHCTVVDPGDAAPVLRFLASRQLALDAILITHHHHDHTGGIAALRARHPVPVHGPDNPAIDGITHPVRAGDQVTLPPHYGAAPLRVLAVPGHTLDHLAYCNDHWLFAGDTLFAAGCGRLFEGTAAQMRASLDTLAALPPELALYCAHEYTLDNLRFACAVEPGNADLQRRAAEARQTRADGRPTLPSRIALERASNPFLRYGSEEIRRSLERYAAECGLPSPADDDQRFALLREWKNRFRA